MRQTQYDKTGYQVAATSQWVTEATGNGTPLYGQMRVAEAVPFLSWLGIKPGLHMCEASTLPAELYPEHLTFLVIPSSC